MNRVVVGNSENCDFFADNLSVEIPMALHVRSKRYHSNYLHVIEYAPLEPLHHYGNWAGLDIIIYHGIIIMRRVRFIINSFSCCIDRRLCVPLSYKHRFAFGQDNWIRCCYGRRLVGAVARTMCQSRLMRALLPRDWISLILALSVNCTVYNRHKGSKKEQKN